MSTHHTVTTNVKALKISAVLIFAYFFAEILVAVLTGSLSLLADAAHELSTVVAISISLIAMRLARRPGRSAPRRPRRDGAGPDVRHGCRWHRLGDRLTRHHVPRPERRSEHPRLVLACDERVPRERGSDHRALRILVDATPADTDLEAVAADLSAIPGVRSTHHLHSRVITGRLRTFSGHLVIDEAADPTVVLDQAKALLDATYGFSLSTVQVEPEGLSEGDPTIIDYQQPAAESHDRHDQG